jgi:hypothetical protein
MSVTIYQDGPDLANQGTVAAAQIPTKPRLWCASYSYDYGTEPHTYGHALPPAFTYAASDKQTLDSIVRYPNAYIGQSKAGIYMPLKLSQNHQVWHGMTDLLTDATYGSFSGATAITTFVSPPTVFTSDIVCPAKWPYGDESEGLNSDPHIGHNSLSFLDTGGDTPMREPVLTGTLRCSPCNENWGFCCFRNMATTTRLVAYFRAQFEVRVSPTSTLSTFIHLPPKYDPVALSAYFSIARELKDAYPSDYNDLGKLWSVIKNAAKHTMNVLSAVPPFGGVVGKVGEYLFPHSEEFGKPVAFVEKARTPASRTAKFIAGKGLKKTSSGPGSGKLNPRDKPSAAAVDAAQRPRMEVVYRKAR